MSACPEVSRLVNRSKDTLITRPTASSALRTSPSCNRAPSLLQLDDQGAGDVKPIGEVRLAQMLGQPGFANDDRHVPR